MLDNRNRRALTRRAPRHHRWPPVSVVVVGSHRRDVTVDVLTALRECGYPNLEVVLVDVRPEFGDGLGRWAGHYPGIVHVRPVGRLSLAEGVDLGIACAREAYVLLLDGDTRVRPGFLEPMVLALRGDPRAGIVCPKVVAPGAAATIRYAGALASGSALGRGGVIGDREPDLGQYDDLRDTDLPYGACMLVRRELLGGCDVDPGRHAYLTDRGSRELAERAGRRGYRVVYCGYAEVARDREPSPRAPASPRAARAPGRHREVASRLLLGAASLLAATAHSLLVGVPLGGIRVAR